MIELLDKLDNCDNIVDDNITHILHPDRINLSTYLCGAKRDPVKPIEKISPDEPLCKNCLFKWKSITKA